MTPKEGGAGRPGLATTNQVRAWRERLKNERAVAAQLLEEKLSVLGGKVYEPCNYFLYYKSDQPNASAQFHERPLPFTIDKLSVYEPFDSKSRRQRWAPHHRLEAQGLRTKHNILSSQTIGSHKILPGESFADNPRADGNGRSAALRSTLFYPNHLHA